MDTVLNRDLFLKNIALNSTKKHLNFVAPSKFTTAFLDGPSYPVYSNILERLNLDADMESLLQARCNRIQEFLGLAFPLLFRELLCIICGLSNMDIDTHTLPAGSEYGNTTIKQDVVRSLGTRFFELHCILGTIYADLHHLSQSAEELENSLELFTDSTALALHFMKLNSLDKCVVPHRGAHSAGFIENPESVRKAILDKATVASFYTMIGVLVVKFGSREVLRSFWQQKILSSSSGIMRVIASKS